MAESLSLSAVFKATPERLFKAWLDSGEHSAFTGDKADIDPQIGGKFTAWDGYIRGTTTKMEEYSRIIQKWRTTDFKDDHEDSVLEIIFKSLSDDTCELTLNQSNIPDGQAEDYKSGWEDYYFAPMHEYFDQ